MTSCWKCEQKISLKSQSIELNVVILLIWCKLEQNDSERLYRYALDSIEAYATHTGGRISREASAEEDAHRDLLLFMELLQNLLSKDIMDLSPFVNDGSPISASEVIHLVTYSYSGLCWDN